MNRHKRLKRFELALQQSDVKYLKDLCRHENCYDEDELGRRYFKLKNIDAEKCRYPNPFKHRLEHESWNEVDDTYQWMLDNDKDAFQELVVIEKPVEKIVEKIVEVPVEVINHLDEEKIELLSAILEQSKNILNTSKEPRAVYYA